MRRRRLAAAVTVLVLLALFRVPLGVYVLTPGGADPVSPLVVLDGGAPGSGRFLMTTVAAGEPPAAGLLLKVFDRSARFVPRRDFLPPGRTLDAYLADARRQMAESQALAACAALRFLGREAVLEGRGLRVLNVARDGAAAGRLEPGDVIVAAEGRPVRFEEDLAAALPPGGGEVRLSVERGGGARRVRVAVAPAGDGGLGGLASLGLETVSEGLRARLPVGVRFAATETAGPSAGLAFALEIIDRLDGVADLAGGRRVAVTGVVWPSGRVAPVGGVAQKVAAARRAGADLMLVPRENAAEAEAAAGPLRVVPVATVAEAVRALSRAPAPAER